MKKEMQSLLKQCIIMMPFATAFFVADFRLLKSTTEEKYILVAMHYHRCIEWHNKKLPRI